MEQGQNEGVSKLVNVEKSSDNYLNELHGRINELRQKLNEEKSVSGHLQEILCTLQGRISVHYQRAEEVGVENFREMMLQAESELLHTKDEADALSVEIFNCCNVMIRETEDDAASLDTTRIQFKSTASIMKSVEAECNRLDQMSKGIVDAENAIQRTYNSDEEFANAMQVYGTVCDVMEIYHNELEETSEDIAELSLKLQVRRDFSLLHSPKQ